MKQDASATVDTCSPLADMTLDVLHNNETDAEAVQPATTQSGSDNAALNTTSELTTKVIAENTSAMDIAAEELHLRGRTDNRNDETSHETSGTAGKEVKVNYIVSLTIPSQILTLISNFCRQVIPLQQEVHQVKYVIQTEQLTLRCPTNVAQRYEIPFAYQTNLTITITGSVFKC